MLVEALVQAGDVDIDVGVILLHACNAFGRGNQVNEADVVAAAVLDGGDGVGRAAAVYGGFDVGRKKNKPVISIACRSLPLPASSWMTWATRATCSRIPI